MEKREQLKPQRGSPHPLEQCDLGLQHLWRSTSRANFRQKKARFANEEKSKPGSQGLSGVKRTEPCEPPLWDVGGINVTLTLRGVVARSSKNYQKNFRNFWWRSVRLVPVPPAAGLDQQGDGQFGR